MSGINFMYVEATSSESAEFIRMREKHIRESSDFDDNFYITSIFHHLSNVYDSFSSSVRERLRGSNEETITDYIRRELQGNKEFSVAGFLVNSEARNQDKVVGYYDLKFENSYWRNQYLVLECKPVSTTAARVNAYIHTKSNGGKEEDGGLFRFFINKYATDKPFGGMLGYIVSGDPEAVVKKLKSSILSHENASDKLIYGNVQDAGLLEKKVSSFKYSFQSKHTRIRGDKIISPIHLFHLFMDFTS